MNLTKNEVYENKENILKEIKVKNDKFNKELADILGGN